MNRSNAVNLDVPVQRVSNDVYTMEQFFGVLTRDRVDAGFTSPVSAGCIGGIKQWRGVFVHPVWPTLLI